MGYNLELQAGFLNRASSVPPSFQLYSALGLGLGVARVEQDENFEVAIQLWSLPVVERCEGITNSFVRGHKAVIVVITPEEVPRLPEILDSVPGESYKDLMIILVTEEQGLEIEKELYTILGLQIDVQATNNVESAMSVLVNALIHNTEVNLPCALRIDPNECPTLRPIMETSSTPLNTEEEIEFIQSLALDFGFSSTSNICTVGLKEGIAEIDLLSGSVSFKPKLCTFCEKSCKRIANICIVKKEQGWSSIRLGNRALLTIAKIYALTNRELPDHVEKQIKRAMVCQSFTFMPSLFDDRDLLNQLIELGYTQVCDEWAFLEEAEKRFRDGRLSRNAYETIRSMFEKVRSTCNS